MAEWQHGLLPADCAITKLNKLLQTTEYGPWTRYIQFLRHAPEFGSIYEMC